jgi:predicted alpha/beta-fold hydrolase
VVGVSLGGNALLRWAQEAGDTRRATAARWPPSRSPLDLAAGGAAIDRGFNWLVYTRMFLATMKPKALAKWQQHPGLFDRDGCAAARTLYEFDNVFTAPLHGFRDTPDYWARASAKPHLARIRIPALVLNARNDPFVPAASLPGRRQRAARHAVAAAHGGHVGFPAGRFPGHVLAMPQPWRLAGHGGLN